MNRTLILASCFAVAGCHFGSKPDAGAKYDLDCAPHTVEALRGCFAAAQYASVDIKMDENKTYRIRHSLEMLDSSHPVYFEGGSIDGATLLKGDDPVFHIGVSHFTVKPVRP